LKTYIYQSTSYGNDYETTIWYDASLRLWTVVHYCNSWQVNEAEYYNNKNEVLEIYDLKTFTVEGGK
tara:strand:+ start:504 stop:704 length:201 start_codon:yes stop_codon:yes gene_type:complete